MGTVDLRFEYRLPKKAVYEWWTDLSGQGYVGRALKSIRPVGSEGEKVLVETKWKMVGRSMMFVERLSLLSEDHWVWEPEIFGVHITDIFTLQELAGGITELRIHSESLAKGLKGKCFNFTAGWMLKRYMIKEWEAASDAFKAEKSISS